MADNPETDDGKAKAANAAAASEEAAGQTSEPKEDVPQDDLGDAPGDASSPPPAPPASVGGEAPETGAMPIGKPGPQPRKATPRKVAAVGMPGAKKQAGTVVGALSKAARKPVKTTTAVKAAPLKKAGAAPSRKGRGPSPRTAPFPLSIPELKEKIMSMSTPDYTEKMTDVAAQLQGRSKEAYEKGSEVMTEMSDFAKGTVEAMVESGKIFSGAMQEMGKTYVEDAKAAYEQITADLKEMAAVKSPTELLQLQGKIMRRNFDAMVASSSKNAEKIMKISNDAFAPLSARISVATDKISKVG